MARLLHMPLHEDGVDTVLDTPHDPINVSFVADGPIGQDSAEFNGSDSYVEVGQLGINEGDRCTVSMWVKKTATATDNVGQLISAGFGGSANGIQLSSEDFSTETVEFGTGGASTWNNGWINGKPVSENTTFALNEWVHLTADITVDTYDGSEHYIGADAQDPPANNFAGRIADLRVYLHSFSAVEESYLHTTGAGYANYTSEAK